MDPGMLAEDGSHILCSRLIVIQHCTGDLQLGQAFLEADPLCDCPWKRRKTWGVRLCNHKDRAGSCDLRAGQLLTAQ